MRTELLIPVVLLALVVVGAFVAGKLRVGQWDTRRDTVVVVALVIIGAAALVIAVAPEPVRLIAAALGLLSFGTLLLMRSDDFPNAGWNSKTVATSVGVAAVVFAALAVLFGVVRAVAAQ